MGKIIEGYWDCPQCGSKKIRGRYRYCNSCGRPRGKGIKFYMVETDEYVEDDSKISREPDWYCSFCQSLNPASSQNCESCGSSQADSDKNYFQMLEEEERKKKEEERNQIEYQGQDTETANDTINEPQKATERTQINGDAQSQWFKSFGKMALIFFPILMIAWLLIGLAMPKETTLHVLDKTWERTIEVEEYKTVSESDWYLPSGGRLSYTRREIHHYDKVIDHYKTVTEQKSESYISGYETVVTGHRDLGNGYFEEITSERPVYDTRYWTETKEEPVYRDEPVYQTKYYYDIERWVHKTNVKASGAADDPYWPELNLADNERQGHKKESYEIITENKKEKKKTYKIPFNDWNRINVGNSIKVKTSFGSISEIIDIE